jgi:type I restriction enzyme S subunit
VSHIDDLIKQYCPDGVENFFLRQVAMLSTKRIESSEIHSGNFVGVDNLLPNKAGISESNFTPASGTVIEFLPGDILLGNIRPYLKKIWLADREGASSPDVLTIRIVHEYDEFLMAEFLYYVISSDLFFEYNMQHAKGAKMPRGNKAKIFEYSIPVPPIEVQREIVSILDTFTQLEAELEAELEARVSQFHYLRNHLIDSRVSEFDHVSFGESARILRGASPRPIDKFITSEDDGINWIKIGDVPVGQKFISATKERITVEGASKSRRIYPGDFVLSNSMSFGRPYISRIEGCIHDGWLAISEYKENFDSSYLYHLLSSNFVQMQFRAAASNGTVSNLNAEIVKRVILPKPPLIDQQAIAALLDATELLVSDISIGLPAEIQARRKQYEYYRDKLLTFKELDVA